MRLALLATATSIAIAGVMFACSNGPPQAEEADDAGTALPSNNNNTNDNNANNAANNGDNTPAETTDPDASALGDGGLTDAATPGVGTTEGDGGSRCLPTSIRETEPNNDAANATKLPSTTSTLCGRLAAGDVDFFTFTMPQAVNEFFFNIDTFTGNGFKVEPSADGEAFSFNGNYPFKPGGIYTLKITAKAAAEYRLKITIDQ